jgi:hypothetical protein
LQTMKLMWTGISEYYKVKPVFSILMKFYETYVPEGGFQ